MSSSSWQESLAIGRSSADHQLLSRMRNPSKIAILRICPKVVFLSRSIAYTKRTKSYICPYLPKDTTKKRKQTEEKQAEKSYFCPSGVIDLSCKAVDLSRTSVNTRARHPKIHGISRIFVHTFLQVLYHTDREKKVVILSWLSPIPKCVYLSFARLQKEGQKQHNPRELLQKPQIRKPVLPASSAASP